MKELSIEGKKLILKDLCARVPYHPKGHVVNACNGAQCDEWLTCATFSMFTNVINNCRLYLRPMSSMTEEERKEYNDIVKNIIDFYDCPKSKEICFFIILIDWLNAHHFDYSGLIERGLALETPEGMYK